MSLDPPFANRFEEDRLYRIEGERRLFCALSMTTNGELVWKFHPHADFVRTLERNPRHYTIREGNPERVSLIHAFSQWGLEGDDTGLDWRGFQATDHAREGQRWRVYRPLKRATAGAPVR